jgi:GDP-4-dehydro-6-deoxy-D-mannose reductase
MSLEPAEPKEPGRPRVLITGAGGFVGRHLTATLARRQPHWVLDAPCGPHGQTVLDVTNPDAVNAWIARSEPDIVVHLAAIAAVTASMKDPRAAWGVNLNGALNIVLALQALAPAAHLLFVSSAEVYGRSLDSPRPVDESALLQPVNPYAASKAAADILVRQAAIQGLSATVMRPFNHTGVGQSEAFVAPSFAAQIARIEAGLQAPLLEVGSLEEERDFLDVQDVVDAYALVLERRDDPRCRGVFNVASGVAVRIGDILEQLLSLAKVRIAVRVDQSRLRQAPIRRVVGDAARLRAMGWSPKAPLEQTLADLLESARRNVAVEQGHRMP